jgi:hypothetical protein
MKAKREKGYLAGYTLESGGRTFHAVPNGAKFDLFEANKNGILYHGQLKDCKQFVTEYLEEEDEDEDMAPELRGVHPGAWLCYLLAEVLPAGSVPPGLLNRIESDLDSAGWIDVDQDAIDMEKVHRELRRCGLGHLLASPSLAPELESIDFDV